MKFNISSIDKIATLLLTLLFMWNLYCFDIKDAPVVFSIILLVVYGWSMYYVLKDCLV